MITKQSLKVIVPWMSLVASEIRAGRQKAQSEATGSSREPMAAGLTGRVRGRAGYTGVIANSSLYGQVFLDSGENQASRPSEHTGFWKLWNADNFSALGKFSVLEQSSVR